MPQNELNLLTDIIVLLREQASEAKKASIKGDAFEKGRQFAYYEVLSLILKTAVRSYLSGCGIFFMAYSRPFPLKFC